MTILAEAMVQQAGWTRDASGNFVPPKPPVEPAAPARASTPATTSPPATAAAPTAAIPEPPVVGQASPVDRTEVKKKTLLGG